MKTYQEYLTVIDALEAERLSPEEMVFDALLGMSDLVDEFSDRHNKAEVTKWVESLSKLLTVMGQLYAEQLGPYPELQARLRTEIQYRERQMANLQKIWRRYK